MSEVYLTPEARARVEIDRMLAAAGWAVQDAGRANLTASRGVAVREFVLAAPHGRADYLLFVDGAAAGVVEAKKEGETLTGVEWQSAKYVEGLPEEVPTALEGALPFAYESTGTETRFTNTLDPDAASRPVFWFHRPETLAGWVRELREPHVTGSTIRHLPQEDLRRIPVPVPPLDEQQRIVAEIEERLGAIDALRAAIERAQRRSAALRRSVLERAFRGELVPQDPSDEPASALLERIKAERTKAERDTGRRPRRRATMETS